ncbi:MAG: hypothetical protein JKY55_10310, partial [Aliivibrio sp.]|uniref:hypothetical protein n=1 Tax=Aliivibrio sp. TaxID=1872443 RepID=UPI001A49B4FC|nr:hypothetical protein [Aliivibrio sp.]
MSYALTEFKGQCWLAQNLGSSQQAATATDGSALSAGWYWQFNRKQGYQHDGSSRIPNTAWTTAISESSTWTAVSDPCRLLLGSAWRLPTQGEWAYVDSWSTSAAAFGSDLKLHAAGYLSSTDGTLNDIGVTGKYWSSTQSSRSLAYQFTTNTSGLNTQNKSHGFSVRCLREKDINNAAPVATGVLISLDGSVFTGTYTYSDSDDSSSDISTYQWYGADDALGSNALAISGATALTYTADGTYAYYAFEVRPMASTGTVTGIAECSPFVKYVVGTVVSVNGRIWMDCNLGAQVATSSTDIDAYGDLYQWGRGTDGHQLRTSGITTSTSSGDVPEHANFIKGSGDWRSSQNDNLWQGVDGVNNPCPSGFRLPTEAEWSAERAGWTGSGDAFSSPLKLPLAGYRESSDGSFSSIGTYGYYWSSTVAVSNSLGLNFYSGNVSLNSYSRAYGFSVRCIEDLVVPEALSVSVLVSGSSLTGSYTYYHSDGDAQGASTYQWYGADDALGTNALEIAGATAINYTADGSYAYYAFEVTPVAQTGSFSGTAAMSSFIKPVYIFVDCGDAFEVSHVTTGGVAPVNKVVVYGTVLQKTGATTADERKCWITRNLGA